MMIEVQNSVESIIREFQDNPYAFLYEEDIRATLFCTLRNRIPGHIVVQGNGKPENEYCLRSVYCEYGGKIDIACLNPVHVEKRRASHKGFDTFIYNLPIEIGIELKYRKIGDTFMVDRALADYHKLVNFGVDNALVLAFIQSEQDIDKFLGTEESENADLKSFSSSLDGVFVISKNKIVKIASAIG